MVRDMILVPKEIYKLSMLDIREGFGDIDKVMQMYLNIQPGSVSQAVVDRVNNRLKVLSEWSMEYKDEMDRRGE